MKPTAPGSTRITSIGSESIRATPTAIPGVLVIEPSVHADARGYLFESFNRRVFAALTGFDREFVQDNQSSSVRDVVRGLHYQIRQPQAKLVRVISGEIFDVAVDIRRGSPTFGRWIGERLSAENRRMLWIPIGCAHGLAVLSPTCELLYKVSDYYAPEHERCIRWDDPQLGVRWPIAGEAIVSARDRQGTPFAQAETFP